MARVKKKAKTLFTFQFKLLELQNNTMSYVRYDKDFVLQLIRHTIGLNSNRLLDRDIPEKPFYLEQCSLIGKNGEDAGEGEVAYIEGYFVWIDASLRTDLVYVSPQNIIERQGNPKRVGESEERRFYFGIRLSDGLCLLDGSDRKTSPLTAARFCAYWTSRAPHLCTSPAKAIELVPIVSQCFLDKILDFKDIYTIDLVMTQEEAPNNNPKSPMNQLMREGATLKSFKTEVIFRRDKKSSLDVRAVANYMTRLLQRNNIVKAEIRGKPDEEGDPIINIAGIQEKTDERIKLELNGSYNHDEVISFLHDLLLSRMELPIT